MNKKEEKKVYNFGEKKEERINGRKVPVGFVTPKFKEAKAKAIELIEKGEYELLESDFWILMNTYNKGENASVMYSGLIISHDGCLKINSNLEDKLKFRPECVSIDINGYKNSLVYTYICPEQGIYEVGEVNDKNCKNEYPYAMALKRCMDRVILKNSKIAFSGIYSDSESDEFKKNNDVDEKKKEKKEVKKEQTSNGQIEVELKEVELSKAEEEEIKKQARKTIPALETQLQHLRELYTEEELKPFLDYVGKERIEDFSIEEASSLIKRARKGKQDEER